VCVQLRERNWVKADGLRSRPARLLTDSLAYCARGPSTATLPPSAPKAAVLRSVAAQVQRRYQLVWSCYRGYQGNRVVLVEQVAQEILHDGRVPRWGHVVARISFAGTLLEKPPPGRRLRLKECEADVSRDCQSLVALLCDWLSTRLARGTRRLGERGQGTREGLAGRASRDAPLRRAPGDLVAPVPWAHSFQQRWEVECEFQLSPLLAESGWEKPASLDGSLIKRF
uniref:Bcl-2 Bcl-2 homology region 1-3 domain-containing protein n=1 Tax=Rhinolophus ferrumequinum TaxID=59479 RepID=A0A671DJP1_RHIFE